MRFFDKLDKMFSFFEDWTLFITVTISLIALFVNVILRYCFSYSLAWSEELIRNVIIYTSFIAAGFSIKNKSMIKIDALIHIFPKSEKFLNFTNNIASIIFAAFIFFLGIKMSHQMFMTNQTTIIMRIPFFLLYMILPISGLSIFIRVIQNLGRNEASHGNK